MLLYPVPWPPALGQILSSTTLGAAGELRDPFAGGWEPRGCCLPPVMGCAQRALQDAERASSEVGERCARAEGPARPSLRVVWVQVRSTSC